MKIWRNISALKSVKGELETLSGALASALESVITTPVDENKNTEPLRGVVQAFSRVPGTLELLGCTQLALLAQEVLQLLNDTLAAQANLDGRGLDLRLELAFAAVTDLPALLEYSLFQESDEFLFVCQHINKLRKARACAILFSGAPLLEKADVDFRARFEKHPDKMLEILAKQAELFVRCSTALHKNPEDAKALQLSSSVLDNLELLLRDHRIGVLWGLGRAIVESYPEAVGDDKAVLALSLLSLVPLARQLIEKNVATLQDAVDEGILEKLVNVIDKLHAAPGSRAAVVKLWYNIDMAGCREFRNQYRKLQDSYYNKSALNKCLQLIRASIVQHIDAINDQG